MAMYEMKPEYYTGIDFIDQEHKNYSTLLIKHMNC